MTMLLDGRLRDLATQTHTLEEKVSSLGWMAGLHIKVTFKNGDAATGVADKNGDIKSAYVLTLGMGDDLFVPEADIESIELVDDPEYERIDDIHDVCTGDIFVATNGNGFSVVAVDDDDETDCTLAVMVQAEIPDFHDWMFNSNFAYASRRKPKLPNHDGLWPDKKATCGTPISFATAKASTAPNVADTQRPPQEP